jgi:hypothetical protein
MKLHPITQNVTQDGGVPSGMRHIEFILSSDFAGTINGATFAGALVGVYAIEAPAGEHLAGMNYTIGAGSAILTTF